MSLVRSEDYLNKNHLQHLLWTRSFMDKILHFVDSIVSIPQTSRSSVLQPSKSERWDPWDP